MIEVEAVGKCFGSTRALADFDLVVEEGEVVGIVHFHDLLRVGAA